jgi:hypothetical protein
MQSSEVLLLEVEPFQSHLRRLRRMMSKPEVGNGPQVGFDEIMTDLLQARFSGCRLSAN